MVNYKNVIPRWFFLFVCFLNEDMYSWFFLTKHWPYLYHMTLTLCLSGHVHAEYKSSFYGLKNLNLDSIIRICKTWRGKLYL